MWYCGHMFNVPLAEQKHLKHHSIYFYMNSPYYHLYPPSFACGLRW